MDTQRIAGTTTRKTLRQWENKNGQNSTTQKLNTFCLLAAKDMFQTVTTNQAMFQWIIIYYQQN